MATAKKGQKHDQVSTKVQLKNENKAASFAFHAPFSALIKDINIQ